MKYFEIKVLPSMQFKISFAYNLWYVEVAYKSGDQYFFLHSPGYTFLFPDPLTINYYSLQILTSMDSNANGNGEAHKKNYENIFMREFSKNAWDSF